MSRGARSIASAPGEVGERLALIGEGGRADQRKNARRTSCQGLALPFLAEPLLAADVREWVSPLLVSNYAVAIAPVATLLFVRPVIRASAGNRLRFEDVAVGGVPHLRRGAIAALFAGIVTSAGYFACWLNPPRAGARQRRLVQARTVPSALDAERFPLVVKHLHYHATGGQSDDSFLFVLDLIVDRLVALGRPR